MKNLCYKCNLTLEKDKWWELCLSGLKPALPQYFPLRSTCMHMYTCVWVCACLRVYALTVDLQHFGGLLRCLRECHVVHFAGVGYSIIISVHMQLQRAPYCKGLPTCIDLLGTFGESCILSKMEHIYLWRCDSHTPKWNPCVEQRRLALFYKNNDLKTTSDVIYHLHLQFTRRCCSNATSKSHQAFSGTLPLSSIQHGIRFQPRWDDGISRVNQTFGITLISLVAKCHHAHVVVSICTTCSRSCSRQHLLCNPNQTADPPLCAYQHPSNCQGTGEFLQPSFPQTCLHGSLADAAFTLGFFFPLFASFASPII